MAPQCHPPVLKRSSSSLQKRGSSAQIICYNPDGTRIIRKAPERCNAVALAEALPQSFLTRSPYCGKEVVKVEDIHTERVLIVPNTEPNIHPVYFDKAEFCRLAKQSKVLTAQEKINIEEAQENARRKLQQESQARKEYLQSCEKYRVKGARLSELEQEAKRKAQHLLARAFELRQESEDEVKNANRFIISTKCHAIRVAQIAEKHLIAKELAEEEKRLDRMMEQQRQIELQKDGDGKKEKSQKNQEYLKELLYQIEELETERIEEAERKAEEARMMDEAAFQVQLDELHEHQKKMDKQAQTREYLGEINKQLKYFQDLEREERRQADLKVQKFMEEKAAKEAAREAEIKALKAAKEAETARLRAAQERLSDLRAQQDEIKALRAQDEVEREWRKREKEEAERRLRQEEALRKARIEQINYKRDMQALEMAKEKEKFEDIIRRQQIDAEKERLERLQRAGGREEHREAILKQINEKERQRIEMRKQKFQEGVALRTEEHHRQRAIKRTLKRKVEELRASKVPEIYVKEIERQLKLTDDQRK